MLKTIKIALAISLIGVASCSAIWPTNPRVIEGRIAFESGAELEQEQCGILTASYLVPGETLFSPAGFQEHGPVEVDDNGFFMLEVPPTKQVNFSVVFASTYRYLRSFSVKESEYNVLDLTVPKGVGIIGVNC